MHTTCGEPQYSYHLHLGDIYNDRYLSSILKACESLSMKFIIKGKKLKKITLFLYIFHSETKPLIINKDLILYNIFYKKQNIYYK